MSEAQPAGAGGLFLYEASVLVGAAAFGCLLARSYFAEAVDFHRPRRLAEYWDVQHYAALATCILAPTTIAVAGLLLHRFRRGRLGRPPGPGELGCYAASGVLLVEGACFAATTAIRLMQHRDSETLWFLMTPWLPQAGYAVAASWATLRLTGNWRGERTPLERISRLVGFAWLLALAIFLLLRARALIW